MTTALLISIGIILILGLAIFMMFQKSSRLEREAKERESVIDAMKYNNRELRKTLQSLQIINDEKEANVEKIKNTSNNNVAGMLNDQLSNSSGKD